MEKPQIYVSLKHEDLKYMHQILEWDKDNAFEFSFTDKAIRPAFHSNEGAALKDELKAKIKSGTHLLCLVGKNTANNDWINWEIQTASVTGKKVLAVRLDKKNKAPAAALNFGAAWADTFTFEAIAKVIELGLGGPEEIVGGAVMGGMMEK
jgi:hypothetical protein